MNLVLLDEHLTVGPWPPVAELAMAMKLCDSYASAIHHDSWSQGGRGVVYNCVFS